MRKRFIAAIISAAMLITVLSGCGIITKNTDRDLAQIIAEVGYASAGDGFVYREMDESSIEVKTTGTGENLASVYSYSYKISQKIITKRQLVNAFGNVGYYYVQNYGYTVEEVLNLLMEQLVNREIVIQEAVRTLAIKGNDGKYKNGDYPSVEDCLTAEEIIKAENKVYDEEYETIKGYFDEIKEENEGSDDDDDDEDDEEEETLRATQNPVAEPEEEYEQKYTRADENFTGKDEGYWASAVKRYNKRLSQNETGLDRDTYHARLLVSEMEQMVVEKYQKHIEDAALAEWLGEDANYLAEGLSDAQIAERVNKYITNKLLPKYQVEYNKSYETYANNASSFVTALDSYSGDYSMLYSPVEGYFYVKNLLIGFDDTLQAEFDELSSQDLSDSAKKAARAEILKKVQAKDLRDVWKYETNNVTGEEEKVAVEFPTWLNNETGYTFEEGKKSEYDEGEAVVKEVGSDTSEFVTFVKDEIERIGKNEDFTASEYYDKGKTYAENAMVQLIFKYGTDTGMFNNAVDYLVKPFKAGATETYVAEFAYQSREAYKKFLEAKGSGKSIAECQLASMVIVGTDFGWHVIMVTSEITKGAQYVYSNSSVFDPQVLIASAKAGDGEVTYYEKTFTYVFNNNYQSQIGTEAYTRKQSALVQSYRNNDGFVNTYESRYKDLIS